MIDRITRADKQRVLEISSRIWEGDDYLSSAFDGWVEDEQGLFLGYRQEGLLLGFGKLSWLAPGQAWLEGLRKDVQTDVKGIGKQLSIRFLQYLSQIPGLQSVRFSTYFDNIPSIKLNEQLGFQRILTLSLKHLELLSQPALTRKPSIISEEDFPQVLSYISRSRYLAACRNLLSRGWVVHSFDQREFYDYYIRGNRYLAVKQDNQIKGLLLFSCSHYREVFWISFLEADTRDYSLELLQQAICQAIQHQKTEISLLIPAESELISITAGLGFYSWEREQDFLVYEYPLHKLEQWR